MGSKELMLVKANVVRPAKVTTEFAFRVLRLMLSLVGAWISWRTMLVHEATAGAMLENSLTMHAEPEDVGVADVVEVMTGVVVVEMGPAVVDAAVVVTGHPDVD